MNMNKSFLIVGGIVILGVIAIIAWVLRPPAEATAPIEAIPLTTAERVIETNPYPPPTEVVNSYPAPTEPVAQVGEQASYPAPEKTGDEPAGLVIFTIVQNESETRFTLDEELRGVPTTVIGMTDQVAGEMSIDFNNPANSQLGVIAVNARTLVTNNNLRNRAIQNEILQTGSYEFITFTPTAITGLPERVAIGDTISFQITGDLTIRDINQQITFDTTMTVVSADRLEGLAVTTVLRSDYQLLIPSVPNVANVTDEVQLEIAFVAVPK
jgi:polyisoprenoid-binding protein YceI